MNMTDDLDAVLRELAEDEPFSAAPVEEVLARGKRRRRAAVSTAALGVAAAVAIGLVGATVIGGPDSSTQPAEPLTVAAQATGQTTFRLVVTAQAGAHHWRQEGAYDAVARKGYLKHVDARGNTIEQRFIGDEVYIIGSVDGPGARPLITKEYRQDKESGGFEVPSDIAEVVRAVDPDALLATLRDLGTITDLGGGRYSFRHPGYGSGSVSGTVEVRSDKVTKVNYEMGHASLTLEFSDFGMPVEVERP